MGHGAGRRCVKSWAGWVVICLQARQRRHAQPDSMFTPLGSCGKRKIAEMSTIAEEAPSLVGSEDSNLSDGTTWNTPLPEPPETGAGESAATSTDQTERDTAERDRQRQTEAGIGLGRKFAAVRTSPRYESDVANALHLECLLPPIYIYALVDGWHRCIPNLHTCWYTFVQFAVTFVYTWIFSRICTNVSCTYILCGAGTRLLDGVNCWRRGTGLHDWRHGLGTAGKVCCR
eukprot:COSAG03_NODE_360_length_8585_cov_69.712350_6_plen_231_part_00